MVHVGGRTEEARAPQLALIDGLLRQIGMGLAGVGSLPMGKLIQLRIARFSVFLALRGTVHLPLRGSVQHATADLIQLDGFEQCLEVALTKALVALALDDLEEHGTDDGVGEDLQQDAVLRRRAVDEDAQRLQRRQILLMTATRLSTFS